MNCKNWICLKTSWVGSRVVKLLQINILFSIPFYLGMLSTRNIQAFLQVSPTSLFARIDSVSTCVCLCCCEMTPPPQQCLLRRESALSKPLNPFCAPLNCDRVAGLVSHEITLFGDFNAILFGYPTAPSITRRLIS